MNDQFGRPRTAGLRQFSSSPAVRSAIEPRAHRSRGYLGKCVIADLFCGVKLSLLNLSACLLALTTGSALGFTPLTPLPAPRVVESSTAYPGDGYVVAHLLDGDPRSEYSSDSKGTNTFVTFAFPAPTTIGAFRHVDRNDPATITASELIFLDRTGTVVSTLTVKHSGQRGGETFFILPKPIMAQTVKWRVTTLGPQNFGTVGGAELAFYTAESPEPAPVKDSIDAKPLPILRKEASGLVQPVRVTLQHPYAESAEAILRVNGQPPKPVKLQPGKQSFELALPATSSTATMKIGLELNGRSIVQRKFSRPPVRPMTVYILPHSHTDIGYTEIQTDIEKKQVQNLLDGIAAAKRTAAYPEGARFVWNVEVLWAADLYLRRLSEGQRADFMDAVKHGQVTLNGMYLNELTGLCRPEELVRLFRYATQLSEQTSIPIDSVMISDVPGYTWGTVPAMAQAGIKYFSTAPNYFDRIGTILREWENKPFWWLGPDGKSKVLVWIPFWGYAMSHRYGQMSAQLVEDFCNGLAQRDYPYDIAYVRWSGHGDNAVPDPVICDFVRDWNDQNASPRFIISGTSEAFRALEKRYGSKLPVVRGDWTPYWEDGAGSSALETGMNRESSDRLAQAETLFAMVNPRGYPASAFADAWNSVLLYSEHTWGAYCSVNEPERKETREQWDIKRGYALEADQQSRALLQKALGAHNAAASESGGLDLYNTLSWSRTELAVVPASLAHQGDLIIDDGGQPVPSQRLTTGQLVFLASNVPPLASRRYYVTAGQPHRAGKAQAAGNRIENDKLSVAVDKNTGAIIDLTAHGIDGNFADTSGGGGLNDYLFLPGDNLKNLQRNSPVKISVGEPGPLVASLIIESDAPGCKRLRREVRLVAGRDYVELINLVDKARLPAKSYMAKEGKESVNFGFPFLVPNGEIVLDLPLGSMRPEADQMPSACKNWFTVGRWAEVSTLTRGITWVTLDAPLVQVGGITANLLNSQTNPEIWRKKVEPTQKLYSWAMNNHWGTNYRAYQEGPTYFRFILRPHRRPDPAEASRFATGFSQPLLPCPAQGTPSSQHPLLTVAPADVLVTALKPSDDGHGWVIRLFGASEKTCHATIKWGDAKPTAVFLSGTDEHKGKRLRGSVTIPRQGLVTLRAEF
jgi:alpha-mannosidase